MPHRTRVGVGLMLLNDAGQVLLGRRMVAGNGEGDYAAVGGEMEFGESVEAAILRELAEECGDEVQVRDLKQISVINWRNPGGDQWIGLGSVAWLAAGEPRRTEPHKMGEWGWYDLENLPKPLYVPTAWTIEAYLTGKVWFDG